MADPFPLGGACLFRAEFRLDAVKVSDLSEEPACELWLVVFGFVKLAPHMCPAADEFDVFLLVAVGFVGSVAVALQDAAKGLLRCLQQAPKAGGGAAWVPLVEDVAAPIRGLPVGAAECPEVALLGFASAGVEVSDGGFVSLEIGFAEHFLMHAPVDAAEVIPRQIAHPLAHGVAREVDGVAHEEVLFLPVVGLVVAVEVGGDFGGKAGCQKAALFEGRG